ncbi:MAG: V-type ATP synthase subunit D [Myxococcota bacterium]
MPTRRTKTELQKQKQRLSTLRRVLPSLELKRRRLQSAWVEGRREVEALSAELDAVVARAGEALPMLADERFELEGLCRVGRVDLEWRNIAGVRVPALAHAEVVVEPYSKLARPHWVDSLVERWKQSAALALELRLARRRVETLDHARSKTTQRVNLFEKILIPRAETSIREIEIYLGDLERAAVVRSKVAKAKREALEQ